MCTWKNLLAIQCPTDVGSIQTQIDLFGSESITNYPVGELPVVNFAIAQSHIWHLACWRVRQIRLLLFCRAFTRSTRAMSGKVKGASAASAPAAASKDAKAGKDAKAAPATSTDKGAKPGAPGSAAASAASKEAERTAGMGRGHRQKGAGTVAISKGEVTVAGITMKDWMKTPQTLLLEYTVHNKRPKPRYDQLAADRDGTRFRVVLQDQKRPGTDKDLIFMPSRGFHEADEAKHTVALLALHSLNPTLPLERKLPEPYRSLWMVLNGQDPNAGPPGADDDSKDKKQKGKKGAAATASAAAGAGPSTPSGSATAPASAPAAAPVPPTSSSSGPTAPITTAASAPTAPAGAAASAAAPATAPAASTAAAAGAPAAPAAVAKPVKRVHEIPLDVRLATKHVSAADQKREKLEKERSRQEKKNKREAKMRAQMAAQPESYIMMSSDAREHVEGVLRDCQLQASGGHVFGKKLQKLNRGEDDRGAEDGDGPEVDGETEDDEDIDEEEAELLQMLRDLETEDDKPGLGKSSNSSSNTLRSKVRKELEGLGFSSFHAAQGFHEGLISAAADAAATARAAGRSLDALLTFGFDPETVVNHTLDWLCLNLREDQLPPAFDPRGKQIEIRNMATAAGIVSPTVFAPSAAASKPVSTFNGSGSAAVKPPSVPSAASNSGGARGRGAGASSASFPQQQQQPAVPSVADADSIVVRLFTSAPKPAASARPAPAAAAQLAAGQRLQSFGCTAADAETAVLLATTAVVASSKDAAAAASQAAAAATADNWESAADADGGAGASADSASILSEVAGCALLSQACAHLGHGSGPGASSGSATAAAAAAILKSTPRSPHPCDDPLTQAATEIETSAAIYGSDFVVRLIPVPASLAASLLGMPATSISSSGGGIDAVKWAFVHLTVSMSETSFPGSPEGTTLHVSYLSPFSAAHDTTAADDSEAGGSVPLSTDEAMELSAAIPSPVQALLYPNVLPQIWITGNAEESDEGESVTLRPPQRLNLSLHLINTALQQLKVSNPPEPVLYTLTSWYSSDGAASMASPPLALASNLSGASTASTAPKSTTSAGVKSGAAAGNGRKLNMVHGQSNGNGPNWRKPRVTPQQEATMCRDDQAWKASADSKARDSQWQRMQAGRGKLPMAAYKQTILDSVNNNQVVLLSGETGCGKTTQLPQFILEDAIARGHGGHIRIICTQPRRIAAIGVASRVAAERCEPLGQAGGAVGYQIRGERKAHPGTSLLFTTTGVLLRRLTNGLGNVTHIIVDEVHERGVETDFLLAVLRSLLPFRPDLKVVLMSATMDAAAFATYFAAVLTPSSSSTGGGRRGGNAHGSAASSSSHKPEVPIISVPGFVHPVTEVYLEQVIQSTGYIPRIRDSKGREKNAAPSSSSAAAAAGASQAALILAGDDGDGADDVDPSTPMDPAPGPGGLDLRAWKSHGLDYGLCASLIHWVCSNHSPHANDDGSVLVFMPGSIEIRRLHREVEKLGRTSHMHILHLHGSLSGEEQSLVFKRAPPGKRKVVISTNVAETSITIDDVTVVIDTFRVKESGYDHTNKMSKLVETWTSQAAGRQRRGRAGRVRPGTCYRLIPKAMLATLAPQGVPEIQRVPLEALVLQVKLLRLGRVADFMRSLLDPPSKQALKASLSNLIEIGALQRTSSSGPLVASSSGGNRASSSATSAQEPDTVELTPLGYHLALLPVDVRLAKALIFSTLLGCADAMLTIAAALSERSPFRPITGQMDEDTKAQMEAARKKFEWGQSDHLAVVRAFNGWSDAGGWNARRDFADRHFLSHETMRGMEDTRQEFAGVLADLGFLPGRRCARYNNSSGNTNVGAASGPGDEYSDDEESTIAASIGSGAAPAAESRSTATGVSVAAAGSRRGGGGGSSNNRDRGRNDHSNSDRDGQSWGRYGELSPQANSNSEEVNVIRAALVAGLYPHVVRVVPPDRRYHSTFSGSVAADHKSKELKFYTLQDPADDDDSSDDEGANNSKFGAGSSRKGKPGKIKGRVVSGSAAAGAGGDDGSDSSSSSEDDEEIEQEIVVAAPSNGTPGAGSKVEKRQVSLYHGLVQDRVFIHPASFCFSVGEFRCPWLVYHEKANTGFSGGGPGGPRTGGAFGPGPQSRTNIRDCSVTTPFAMILFGGPLTVRHREAKIAVGSAGWIHFKAEPRIGVLAKGLRAALSRLLADKIRDPSLDVSGNHPVIAAMLRLLIRNGM